MERDTLSQGSRKKLRSKILWEKELLWSDLQVAARRLALSEMNSDAVSYTYAPKRIMWRLITNKEDIKYKLYRMQYEKIKATERRQR